LGYVGATADADARFVNDPQPPHARRYRTGDLVRRTSDGLFEYVGRGDAQLKISGHRIEPSEIEQRLVAHRAVAAASVVAIARGSGLPTRLVAFVVAAVPAESVDEQQLSQQLRDWTRAHLPAPMVPSSFRCVPALPLTPNGKVDRQALREMVERMPSPMSPSGKADTHTAAVDLANDGARLRATLQSLWRDLLGGPVATDANIFDLGASSLLVIRATARLAARDGVQIPAIAFLEHPTIDGLVRSLTAASVVAAVVRPSTSPRDTDDRRIAIVGAAARYPGAPTLAAFWELLQGAQDAITHFTDDTLDPGVSADDRADPSYVRARGVLSGIDTFDAAFFGISPREAQLTDPQQRLWLELAWEALEDAGMITERTTRVVGVFGGMYNSTYLAQAIAARPELVRQYGEFNAMLLNEKDYVAPRVAHRLGLRGPAISIHSACSTSLVAICQAVQSLRDGSCDVALAGGVSLTLPSHAGYRYQEGSMLSPDGTTRPFDAQAQGTVFSDGAGVVVLKRYTDAVRDGDQIYALVRGVGVNNDGAGKASFTAPSVTGQAEVLRRALSDAGLSASQLSYVEAHGTATPLGDPLEFEALKRVYTADGATRGGCRLGSIKGHLGHTVIGAGVAGVLKTALALRHELLPGTANFVAPHPALAIEESPFVIHANAVPWLRGATPRFAGVSSFGVGGTNAHVILEEPPRQASTSETSESPWPAILPLSTRSAASLDALTTRLDAALAAHAPLPLDAVALTLQTGRARFAHRRAIVAQNVDDARSALASAGAATLVQGTADAGDPAVTMLFPGQGAQYAGMGHALYDTSAVYREAFDRCAVVAEREAGIDLRRAIDEPSSETLRDTAITQPALYATSFALASLWQSWGVRPAALVGHSVGEFVAAALAGVFSVEDGMRMVCARGRLMQALPPGRMLAVAMDASTLLTRLPATVSIAAENGPAQCVISGPADVVDALSHTLEGEAVTCRLLVTSHAFHSPMMDGAIDPFADIVRTVTLQAPRIPIISTVTAEPLTPEIAMDVMYWARHLRATVRFGSAVARAMADVPGVLLEVGPGATLSRLARRQGGGRVVRSVASLPSATDDASDVAQVMVAVGQLWCWGVEPQWPALRHAATHDQHVTRVSLPTYPFERQRYWVDPVSVADTTIAGRPVSIPSVLPVMSSATSARPQRLRGEISSVIEEISGETLDGVPATTTFTQIGLDSLVLTQVALALSRRYGIKLAFRQLLESMPSVHAVADHIDRTLPPEAEAPVAVLSTSVVSATTNGSAPVMSPRGMPTRSGQQRSATDNVIVNEALPGAWADLFAQQLQIMQRQLDALAGMSTADAPVMVNTAPPPVSTVTSSEVVAPTQPSVAAADEPVPAVGPSRDVYDATKAFGAAMRVTVKERSGELSPRQRARLDAFIRSYTSRTAKSKAYTAQHRLGMADPRAATGFRPLTKELVYPIVIEKSAGARLWDIDGNEYIDVLSGFGSNLLGWTAPVVVDAITAQLANGFEVGPQHVLAGEVAERLRTITGAERVAFCNTGSEAVLGAIRIARTVTGRPLVAIFTGSYHGINDEVIVRARKDQRAVPAAPGIMGEATENVLILGYGTPESLAILEARADDIAAVIVEPVQSRRPDFQPREFLASLRELCTRTGMVYIWDEIVTGFRAAPGGAQEHFGIRGDLATYGKIVGGGLPIGVIAGAREFMDALDGGQWQYGDASVPEVGVTYFAGTFVRHPLALAAAKAMLDELLRQGPSLQRGLSERTSALAAAINAHAQALGVPVEIRHFASVWKTFITADTTHSDLLFYALRERGIHIYDGFPCFMTAAHGDAECEAIVDAFAGAMDEMREGGFLPSGATAQ
ncbi:MAG: aminotransferase class III-fold pyridoxal phosphate-dependent enzyme, partial [Gemmatimonadaceae bacterium]|nr:aminotransferase class III-fold pyridoxal phosphate-dependent enzyme [Gemmatimonadaceae bacterium]